MGQEEERKGEGRGEAGEGEGKGEGRGKRVEKESKKEGRQRGKGGKRRKKGDGERDCFIRWVKQRLKMSRPHPLIVQLKNLSLLVLRTMSLPHLPQLPFLALCQPLTPPPTGGTLVASG